MSTYSPCGGLISPLSTHAAMWQSSCARVWRNFSSVSVTLVARSTDVTCVTVEPLLILIDKKQHG